MKLIIHKILRHKSRYVSLILSLVIVQTLVTLIINSVISLPNEIIPDKIFNVDRVYQLKIMCENPTSSDDFFLIGMTPAVLEAIKNIEGIDETCSGFPPKLTGEIDTYQLRSMSDSVQNVFHTEAGVGFEKIFDVELIKGKFFSDKMPEQKEVLITETLAKKLNLLNKPLPQIITLPGRYDSIEWQSNVCGIIKDLNYYKAQKKGEKVYPLISKNPYSNSCVLKVKKGIDLATLESKIKHTVSPFLNGNLAVVEIVALEEQVWMSWNSMKNQVLPIIIVIPTILLYTIMALFGLFLNDVMRKKPEFGIMRAIGFNRFQIFSLIMKEVMAISGVTMLSVLLLGAMIPDVRKIICIGEPNSFLELWIMSSVIITVLVVLSAIIPAIKITRIQPVEALAEE